MSQRIRERIRRGFFAKPYVPPLDTVPDAFAFVDVDGAATSTVYESNVIVVAGINGAAGVTTTGEYSKNGGAYTAAAGLANVGDTFKVRVESSAVAGQPVSASLTIGGVTDTFTVTTAAGGAGPGLDFSDPNNSGYIPNL